MLKTIQMQKAKPTQKQNKKPTHNAGKITKKKLKKPKFIGGAKISNLSMEKKLGFLNHCLNIYIDDNLKKTINGDFSRILDDFNTDERNITKQIEIIKYVLLCLCSKDITENNQGYLILKNNYKTIIVTEEYKNLFDDENLDNEIKNKLLAKADELYHSFLKYVQKFVDRYRNDSNNSTNTISNFTNYIFRIFNEIAILTVDTNGTNKKHKLKIINNKNIKTEYESDDEIKNFFKINTNFLIIKNKQNNQYKDYYNCMMQIIMKLVDIFSSDKNIKYYERIINGEPESEVYLSMNEDASTERQKVAQEERLKEQANDINGKIGKNQGIQEVETAKAQTAAAKIEAQTAATAQAKEKAEADKKAAKAETIKKRDPGINLDNLLDYIFNDDNTKQLDLQRQAILLKSLKMICYNKLYKLYGRNFNKEIDNKYTAIINKTKENINEIIKESIYTYALPELRCNSSEMIEAYQHIINILVPKYGLDITEECYETLIALSYGMTDNNCKTTIGDILTQKNYLLSEPKIIKVLLTEKYLNDLGNLEGIAIAELKKFKQKVLEILNEIFNVPAYKDTQSKVLKIYKSLHDIIVTDYSDYTDLANVLFGNIINAYHGTKKDIKYPDIQKTPEEIKFDELLDIVFNKIKIDIAKNIMPTFTEHSIILKSLKLVSYNKLNKLFADFNDKIYIKYIDKMEAPPLILKLSKNEKDFIKEQSTIAITSFRRQCSTEEMVEAFQHIINIIDKEIDSQSQILLENLSLGAKDPDCKSTIRKIVKNKSYLLSKPNMMRKEIDIYFLNDENFRTKYEDSSENPEVTLKKYYDLIDTSNKDTNFPYDIKSKLLNDYEKIRAKIMKKHTNKSFPYVLHYISPPLKPKK